MKLNKDQAKIVVINTILNDIRHPDYHRTVELADLYKKIITGKDIDSLLIQFNPREDLVAFEQRKRITKVTTPAMASSVMKHFYKVPRTDRVVKKIIPIEKGNLQRVNEIQEKLDLFYGSDNEEGGLDFWLKNRFVELSFTDPNTFIVIEFDEFDATQTTPNAYPYEVSSYMAVNFEIENNNVDWLISREPIKYLNDVKKEAKTTKNEYKDGFSFIMYCGEFSYKLRQISDKKSIQAIDLMDNEEVLKIGEKYYAFSEYDTKLQDWQSFRIGYNRDIETDGRTYVNPFHPALCHFEKSIKSVSEFDLTNATHVFPQKIAYVSPCQGALDPESKQNMGCDKGRTRIGEICPSCSGAGVQVHKTAQDVLTFPLPENKDEMFPLKDMMAYFAPPIELLEFQDKQIDKFEPKIHQAVFNSTVLVQKTIVATATEKDQDMDSVYDTLTPFANKSSAVYLNIANAVAVLIGMDKMFSFVYRYPSDFKMKNRQTLYTEIKTINDSGAPSFVKESVEDDLANQVFIDNPEGLLEYTVKKKLQPFTGKTEDQIAFALSSSYTPDRSKVLFLNFDDIINEASRENTNFFMMPFKKQKGIVDEIVNRYITELTPAEPKLPKIDPIIEEEV